MYKYKRIILSLSLVHGFAPKALSVARALRAEGGEIIAVHVCEAPHESVKSFLDKDATDHAFQEAKKNLSDKFRGADDVETVVLSGHASRTLVDYAERAEADLVIVGSHMPGLSDYFLGSTASRVVRHASCDVHVLRHPDL